MLVHCADHMGDSALPLVHQASPRRSRKCSDLPPLLGVKARRQQDPGSAPPCPAPVLAWRGVPAWGPEGSELLRLSSTNILTHRWGLACASQTGCQLSYSRGNGMNLKGNGLTRRLESKQARRLCFAGCQCL